MPRLYFINIRHDAGGIREGFSLPCFSSGVKEYYDQYSR